MSRRERPGSQAGPGQQGDTGQPEPPGEGHGDASRKRRREDAVVHDGDRPDRNEQEEPGDNTSTVIEHGALFGLAFHQARRISSIDQRRLALAMALSEHLALYPLFALIDRKHPARGTAGLPPMFGSGRAFLQATWRHALFGSVLGRLA